MSVFDVQGLGVAYGSFTAVKDISLEIPRNKVTALIGPSGCGKSTVLRCLNRMNDLMDATVSGKIIYNGEDIYGPEVDAAEASGTAVVRVWVTGPSVLTS